MRKSIKETKTVEVEVAYQKVCNKCGKEEHYDMSNDLHDLYHEFEVQFEYASKEYDSQRWIYDLCESCLVELVKEFKILPKGWGETGIEGSDWNQEEEFNKWKDKK